jgi:hypothetical protein
MPELRAMRIRAGIEPSQKDTPKDRTTIFGAIVKTIKAAEIQGFFVGEEVFPGTSGESGRGRNRGQSAAPKIIPAKLRRNIRVRSPEAAGGKKSKSTKLR